MTTTVLHFNFSNSICVHKFIYLFCVHLTVYMCASFCPVEQLIIGHMINMANTLIKNLCDRKMLSQPMFHVGCWIHKTLISVDAFRKAWKVTPWSSVVLMQNLQLCHLSANSELNT